MKNHAWVDGQLLQTNKKWSQLKERQKTWIYETAKKEYDRFVFERGKQPVHGAKKALIERIYDLIIERGIWIPFGEVSRVLSRRIAHWHRVSTTSEVVPGEEQTPGG
jgi:sortase (surface protein transpeptidase)